MSTPLLVALGNITGAVAIDLSRGNYFTGTLTGNATFAITNAACRDRFVLDLTQGGAGGFTKAFNGAGGIVPADPALTLGTGATTVGARTVFEFASSGPGLVVLGANVTPAS